MDIYNIYEALPRHLLGLVSIRRNLVTTIYLLYRRETWTPF